MTKKILIIDDDPRNIFALEAVLKAKKIACITATNATEGIDLMQRDKSICIVLMDMMMPEMDGYEAIRLIRENPELSSTPLIAVTAQAMLGDREKCLAAGANAYIAKPINIDQLLLILSDYI